MKDSYTEILRQCTRVKDLSEGKRIHKLLIEDGFGRCRDLGNLLVQMYGRCNSLEEASMAFEQIAGKTVLSWNVLAGAYAQRGYLREARRIFDVSPMTNISSWNAIITAYFRYDQMQIAKDMFDQLPEKSEVSWNLIISAFATKGHLQDAKTIFESIPAPASSNWSSIISGLAKAGCLEEAKSLFDQMPEKTNAAQTCMIMAYSEKSRVDEARNLFEKIASQGDLGCWGAIIQAYLKVDRVEEACQLLRRMHSEGFRPERSIFLEVLNSCARFCLRDFGREVHSTLTDLRLESDVAIGTALLNLYGRLGDSHSASKLFLNLRWRDVVAWTALVSAFGEQRDVLQAKQTFGLMPQWNLVSWTALVTAFAESGDFIQAMSLYNEMPEKNRVSLTAIIASFARNGYIEDARSLFDQMHDRDVVAWSAMINAYAQFWQESEALELFRLMDLDGVKPNKTTFLAVLEACANLGNLHLGRLIHSCVVECACEKFKMVQSAIVNMYGKCGSVLEAKNLFDSIRDRDMVLMNAMLAGYAQNGYLEAAKSMFDQLNRPDPACWNSMITAYALRGYINEASELFEKSPEKDVVTWSGMIKAYAQAGQARIALEFFRRMDISGVKPNRVTYLHMCEVCGLLANGAIAKLVHLEIMESVFRVDAVLGTAIVCMYGRCASLENAKSFFDSLLRQYVEPWNSLLRSYSQNGFGERVLGLFQMMVLEGLKPNTSTFVNVLAALGHAGLADESLRCFTMITGDFGLQPTVDHYVCMVDSLARAGRLRDAEELVLSMPFEPEALAWTSLLGACSINSDPERAGRAASSAIKLEPENSALYALIGSIYKHKTEAEAEELEEEVAAA